MRKVYQNNRNFTWIVFIAAFVLIIGLLGGKWQAGYAFEPPTIPDVTEIDPSRIPVNSSIGIFTIYGSGFIGSEWSTDFTLLQWIGPDGQVAYVHPISINDVGTEMVVEFDLDLFHVAGQAEIYIDNHPDDPDFREDYGPLTVTIVPPTQYLYLPLIVK